MIETWKAHIEDSIAKALRHESHIDKEILEIRGFSTGVMRRLISNLCHFEKENLTYLEVGLYGGATFCAACNNNPLLIPYGIDNYGQDFGVKSIWQEMKVNMDRFSSSPRGATFNNDFFKMEIDQYLRKKVDIFFYDGEHSYESQAKALPHALPILADHFLFIVDDYDWDEVWYGTNDSLFELTKKVEILATWKLTDNIPDGPNWHNGVAIFLCKKIV